LQISFAENNLIDEVWTDRPPSSATTIFVHEEWAGKSITEKVGWIRNHVQQKSGEAAIFANLGEIAWILNLRSSEIPYNPLFKSILLVSESGGTLYLPKSHPSENNDEVCKHLLTANIAIKPYDP
jgi:Xaa-Pro aminopeptidase